MCLRASSLPLLLYGDSHRWIRAIVGNDFMVKDGIYLYRVADGWIPLKRNVWFDKMFRFIKPYASLHNASLAISDLHRMEQSLCVNSYSMFHRKR